MKLILSVDKKNEAERMVLICIIGLLDSLENNLLTIEECEGYLFSPYSVTILKEKNLDSQVIEILELGCELEDVQSLLPDKLQAEIQDLKARAKECLKKSLNSSNQYQVQNWLEKQ
ncbi:DUF3969 family protein [Listeria booriae]|uniref:DUF3969 family protein n=1 Tax=Listeria booriae TaxID=1552123 RepID=UPI0016287750|nr:DUF3969 family protein [Listeria booriae]MBC1504080.1 DUF3969 family protein [Listeria booriae]